MLKLKSIANPFGGVEALFKRILPDLSIPPKGVGMAVFIIVTQRKRTRQSENEANLDARIRAPYNSRKLHV